MCLQILTKTFPALPRVKFSRATLSLKSQDALMWQVKPKPLARIL